MAKKNIVFDIVGTLVSFNAFYARIEEVIGHKLRSQGNYRKMHGILQFVSYISAGISTQLFGYSWMTAAELEFTFLSISSRHTSYKDVMKAVFYRTLWMAGVANPREFASDDERERCQEGYSLLELREGAKECIELLRQEGWQVWCFTTADVSRVKGYFERGGVDMPTERFISCDESGVAKPDLRAYKSVLEKFGEGEECWFAAAHMWDVSAARRVGFKGAYCSVYEKEDCREIFGGDMEVMADSLVEMAREIVEKGGK